MRGLPPRRRAMGAPAPVHGMWSRRLLRQFTQPPRNGPLACASRAPACPFLRTGRRLVVVLRRRAGLRAERRPTRAQPPLNCRCAHPDWTATTCRSGAVRPGSVPTIRAGVRRRRADLCQRRHGSYRENIDWSAASAATHDRVRGQAISSASRRLPFMAAVVGNRRPSRPPDRAEYGVGSLPQSLTYCLGMDSTARTGDSKNASTISELIVHYGDQKTKWRSLYYASKAATIILAAAIPVMTTADAWPWTIAIVGSLIVALESIAELWHFHDRYVARECCKRRSIGSDDSMKRELANTRGWRQTTGKNSRGAYLYTTGPIRDRGRDCAEGGRAEASDAVEDPSVPAARCWRRH